MMRKFYKKLGLFLLLAITCYYVIIICSAYFAVPGLIKFFRGGYGHSYTRLQEVKSINDIDVLICGSSHAYRGFDSRVFDSKGYTSFNLGSSNQSHIQTAFLLKRYVTKISPKLVLYEVYPEIFGSEGVESAIDLLSNDFIDIESIHMGITLKSPMVINTLHYAWFHNYFHKDKIYLEDKIKGEDAYVSGGYVEKKLAYNTVSREIRSYKTIYKDKQVKAMKNALKLLKDLNIPCILVFAPITTKAYKAIDGVRDFNMEMQKYGPYINFNGVCQLDDSLDFYDAEHLNQNGVGKFNVALIDSLEKGGSLYR